MREICSRKDEFAKEYLDSPDINKKKMYFNAYREAICKIKIFLNRLI